ncbi:MAG: hypothetical protein ACUVRM_06230 [Bacillota bacterium]
MPGWKRSILTLVTLVTMIMSLTIVHAGSYTITVTGAPDGLTELSIGAVEGNSRFNVAELVDVGFKNYRIYAGMSRLEPEDDDGVYGSPSIAEIKANPGIIPWAYWDYQFTRQDGYFWSGEGIGVQVSLYQILSGLKANGIRPIVTLRNVDNDNNPPWAQELNPPNSPEDWNEWWEHVFATVYWCNVLHNLEVHDWEVHNEPDNSSQGWAGTLQDYILFTQYTYDAIKYVYDTFLPGKTFRLYAPVATHCNEWITNSIIQNDAIIDVIDWHRYGPPYDEAVTIHGWIDQYDSDGIHEPLCLSEWGSYRDQYTSVGDALNYATYLIDHNRSESKIEFSSVFSMYDWIWPGGDMKGLVAPDGTKRECYWMFRMMCRGLNCAKQKYAITHNIPANVWVYPIAAKDQTTGTLYVEIINKSAQPQAITLDLSAHTTSGTVTFREYSANKKDEVIGSGVLSNGKITFTMPKSSILQVILISG